jgi:hypothetical protein
MRHNILTRSLLLASFAALASCGGGGGGEAPFTLSTSAQSAALGAPGSATASTDARSVTLVGGDGGTTGCSGAQYGFTSSPCTVTAAVFSPSGTYSFDWSYSTKDSSGPGADLFGMVVDGRTVPLSDPGGPLTQSGHSEVTATSSLAFYVNCTDCTDGAATAAITSFQRK